jgi:hypothetical protein
MSNGDSDSAWEAATWEGSRRAHLRRALRLSVRERLEVLEALSEASELLTNVGRRAQDAAAVAGEGPAGSAGAEPK